ncbi:MAG TPA: bifunctional UDP-N-acetylmuramoyl-tripeptide:D-alanyl-D-alanine ligase/alanine racemase [Chryseolinea sp.]|nr:bifunctional UDP-N-acetylmuramoyl-tripeptide:D-alanyl-D-alanine ligase/alanine racemase [Chryseolinea sp.]
MINFSQLEKITNGTNLLYADDRQINTLCVDSRKATEDEGTIFFAIKGDRNDGHDYLRSLYKMGVRQFVVEHSSKDLESFAGANILLVNSSIQALQSIVTYHRSQFSIPVIGITGSNGKTIVKEWLFEILSKDRSVAKNPGSYNSQIGVPLSVWQMRAHHQLGIFEAGISRPDEMKNLEKVINPTIGIFTNIGSAHSEGFTNLETKIREKLKLFGHVDFLIYCTDHEKLHSIISDSGIRTFTWGTNGNPDVLAKIAGTKCELRHNNESHTLQLYSVDKASQENCLHCVALMLSFKYSFSEIQDRVRELRSIPMRMEVKEGINQCQVIDDTYNNDLGGLEIALQFLSHQHQKKKKRVILSDILESGLDELELVQQISSLITRANIQLFIGIGPVLSKYKTTFPASAGFYTSTDEFLKTFDFDELGNEVILVKGARTFAFEKIVHHIQRKVHGTVMEIDLDSVIHNLNFFKSLLKPSTKIMVMVKAFGYGSGSIEIANILQYHKVNYLGVAYADEGVELRRNNISIPILVMNPSEDSFDAIVTYDLEPEIYSMRIFNALIGFLEGRPCKIHLKLDTGMHRLGFEEADIPEVIALLKSNQSIKVASIFSHLAGADESTHDDFSQDQFNRFSSWAEMISESIGYKPLYHVLNSPGILRLPHFQLDMVRLGIGLYGVDPTNEGFNQLRPVATLKTLVSQVKHIKKGESIGYGRSAYAEKDSTIATIAVGYADGFSRAFSRGVGEVLIRGQKAKVIGNVCMDMTMIDVTDINVMEGDEVILFGKDFPIQEIASSINTIPYEILTSTSERVKRIFISGGI